MKTELPAETGDVGFRFMITRENVHALGALLHNRTELVEATAPVREVAVGEVVIRFGVYKLFQGRFIAVDIGEDEQFHGERRAEARTRPGREEILF